ncbi:Pentatricopeptide repeat [Quillaja saponaria]|uniref:Pentatricopeptide repeat n=1 Tax=Quillaja saponaria TaxID=32244 RepID=A0AAD7LCP8_QUISA|nr:Pentatricopeptide repeat [Quillaja saponaria]
MGLLFMYLHSPLLYRGFSATFFNFKQSVAKACSSVNASDFSYGHGHYSSKYGNQQLVGLLDQCSDLKHLHQTHGFMLLRGLDQDDLLLSRFIHTSASMGYSSYAYSVFTHNARPNIFFYNTVINAILLTPSFSAALRAIFIFNLIQMAGLRPDSYSFPFVLKAAVRLSAINVGRQIHCQAIAIGLDSHVSVATALVQMYSSCARISDARKLFDSMCFKDVVLWNAMVAGYAKVGDVDNARNLFERMPQRNVISWTAVIAGYAQMNRPNEAITLFRRMQLHDVDPDEIAILAVLSACADLGALELGEWIHRLALHGLGREALQMFSRMENARVKPNEITFIAILSACSHVGLVEQGRWYFNHMESRYGIGPKIEHYGCMIDIMGRAGYIQEAKELVDMMPFEANAAIWGSLLAASHVHGDAKLGEQALSYLIKLEPCNSGNYTLLSNTYAAFGRWNESRMVRKIMRDIGVKKIPGMSFIEVNNKVHEFIAGDKSHLEFKRIFDILCRISEQMKMIEHQKKENNGLLEFEE